MKRILEFAILLLLAVFFSLGAWHFAMQSKGINEAPPTTRRPR